MCCYHMVITGLRLRGKNDVTLNCKMYNAYLVIRASKLYHFLRIIESACKTLTQK